MIQGGYYSDEKLHDPATPDEVLTVERFLAARRVLELEKELDNARQDRDTVERVWTLLDLKWDA